MIAFEQFYFSENLIFAQFSRRYFLLTLSWRRPLSYRNQSIDLRSNGLYMITASVKWFLYDNGLRHERVKDYSFFSDIFLQRYIKNCWQYFYKHTEAELRYFHPLYLLHWDTITRHFIGIRQHVISRKFSLKICSWQNYYMSRTITKSDVFGLPISR